MISPVLDEPMVGALLNSFVLDYDIPRDVKDKLQFFLDRLTESARLVVMPSHNIRLLGLTVEI